jgi:predicted dinucleotide-binding enzyme
MRSTHRPWKRSRIGLSIKAVPIGVPIAGNDTTAIELASRLIREVGFELVLIGDLAKGKYLVPGSPLAGQHTPTELRQIASTLGRAIMSDI